MKPRSRMTIAGSTYKAIRKLGTGNYGTVWLAENRQTSEKVAIKLIKDNTDTQLVKSLRREALHLQKLSHPGIPYFIGCEFSSSSVHVAMEYVSGPNLDEWLLTKPNLKERKKVLLTIIEALNHAHQKLIVHLDLKNANIIVNRNLRGVVLDWGVAKTTMPDGTLESPEHLGNLRNTPPECFKHYREHSDKIFPYRSVQDIWSLGVIAYQVLSGRHPFDVPQDLIRLQERIIHTEPQPLPNSLGVWRDLIDRMLKKEPAKRFQACSDILQKLDKKYLKPSTLDEILEPLVRDLAYQLMSSDEMVVGRMAETNALGYFLDQYEIFDIEEIPNGRRKPLIKFKALIHYTGDQDQDRVWCGDAVKVELRGVVAWDGKRCSITSHEIERCDINLGDS